MEIRDVSAAALSDAALLRREAIGEAAVVLTDLDAAPSAAPATGLGTDLTSVVVGVTDADDPISHPLAPLCDVVIGRSDDTSLDAILATATACPVAARSLVLLLRGAEDRSVDDGLLVESAAYSALQSGPEFAAWRASRPSKAACGAAGEAVRVTRVGGVLELTLARPDVRNALDTAMRDALIEALDLADADPSVTEVHLRGEGPSFCAGGDLDEFGSFADPASAHLVRLDRSVARAIFGIADRLVVHLHGSCFGSGVELPAFARTVVADTTTKIALPELSLGLVPGAGGTVSLPRRIGRHRTAWLALTGIPIDAVTALEWGLADGIEGSSA